MNPLRGLSNRERQRLWAAALGGNWDAQREVIDRLAALPDVDARLRFLRPAREHCAVCGKGKVRRRVTSNRGDEGGVCSAWCGTRLTKRLTAEAEDA